MNIYPIRHFFKNLSHVGWPVKTKEVRSPHGVRLRLLGTNPVFLKEESVLVLSYVYLKLFRLNFYR